METPPLIAYILKHAPQDRELLSERFASLAQEALMLSIVETIPQEHVATFETLLARKDSAGIQAFLDAHIQNPDAFVSDALADVREAAHAFLDATS